MCNVQKPPSGNLNCNFILCVCQFACMFVSLSVYLSVCQSLCMFVSMYVYIFVSLYDGVITVSSATFFFF